MSVLIEGTAFFVFRFSRIAIDLFYELDLLSCKRSKYFLNIENRDVWNESLLVSQTIFLECSFKCLAYSIVE